MSTGDRRLVIVGGSNGAGKSSVGSAYAQSELGVAPLDPDLISAGFRSTDRPWHADSINLLGVIETERRVWQAVAESRSVGVETVLSTDKYHAVMQAAASRFERHLIYVGLRTPDEAVERVRQRVAKGGHDVPEEKIRSRWKRSYALAVLMLEIVDVAVIFSNSGLSPTVVATKSARDGVVLHDQEALPELTRLLNR